MLGSTYTRQYTFTRNSGGGGATTYNLSWVGNDGTFSSRPEHLAGKGAPTHVDVTVQPHARSVRTRRS